MTEYWKRIKSILDTMDKSWTQLGNQVGIEQLNLSKKIKADSYPDADTHNRICNVLGISGDFLFAENDDHLNPEFIDIHHQIRSLNKQQADAVRALLLGFKNSAFLKSE